MDDLKSNDKGDVDLMTPEEVKKYINETLKDSLECYLIKPRDNPISFKNKIQFQFPKTTLGTIIVDIDLFPKKTKYERFKEWCKTGKPIDVAIWCFWGIGLAWATWSIYVMLELAVDGLWDVWFTHHLMELFGG